MRKKHKRFPELSALKGRIREQKTSYRKLSAEIDMAPNTLCDKINGFAAFDTPEVEVIAEKLEIEPYELVRYFFPDMLRNATR